MDREAWHAAVHGVAKSQTQLSDWTDWLTDTSLEKIPFLNLHLICLFIVSEIYRYISPLNDQGICIFAIS